MGILKKLLKLTLALLVITGLWFALAVLHPLEIPLAGTRPDTLLVRGVQLVNLESGAIEDNTDILVRKGDIVAVGTGLDEAGATVIAGAGLFAIPGLFDMHVHSIREAPALTHPLFIAAGVTAVRDMGGCLDDYDSWVGCAVDKRHWTGEVERGSMVGPRFDQVTSLAIDGGREIPAGHDPALGAATPEGARARVAHDLSLGTDFLKPYSSLPREGYFALAKAARQNGLYLAGHQPMEVTALEAAQAGQRSIEHAFLFIWDCYPGMQDLRDAGSVRAAYTDDMRRRMIAEHDAEACAELQRELRWYDVAYVPTHTTRKLDAYALDESFRTDPRLRYIATPLRELWLSDATGMAERTTAEGLQSYRDFYEFGIQQTGIAHANGVTVLAGTDAPDSFAFPGFALHDELEHLVQGGLSPVDALRSATTEAARFLELEKEAGALVPGARADLVLLRANPLEDIAAVREIDTVVLAGVPYNRAALDEMLATVEDNASHWSIWPKFLWMGLGSPIVRAQFAD